MVSNSARNNDNTGNTPGSTPDIATGSSTISDAEAAERLASLQPALLEKYERLRSIIRSHGRLKVAFSGGVDSSFLLRVAHDVLGDQAEGVTAQSATFPAREYNEAVAFAAQWGIPHRTIVSEELDVEGFADNPTNRCFLCKSELFGKIRAIADLEPGTRVAEGSNADDLGDYRPGLQAVAKHGVVSPLREAGLTKQDIRDLSWALGLGTWDKPAFACLSSRFPYGERITVEKLTAIDQAEQFLREKGFRQVRVRHHGTIGRIEVDAAEIARLLDAGLRAEIDARLKACGFTYVCVDLKGYRTGSMNETLAPDVRRSATSKASGSAG